MDATKFPRPIQQTRKLFEVNLSQVTHLLVLGHVLCCVRRMCYLRAILGKIPLRKFPVPVLQSHSAPCRVKSLGYHTTHSNAGPDFWKFPSSTTPCRTLQKRYFGLVVNTGVSSFHVSDRALGQVSACSYGSGWKPVKFTATQTRSNTSVLSVRQVPNEAVKRLQQKECFFWQFISLYLK